MPSIKDVPIGTGITATNKTTRKIVSGTLIDVQFALGMYVDPVTLQTKYGTYYNVFIDIGTDYPTMLKSMLNDFIVFNPVNKQGYSISNISYDPSNSTQDSSIEVSGDGFSIPVWVLYGIAGVSIAFYFLKKGKL